MTIRDVLEANCYYVINEYTSGRKSMLDLAKEFSCNSGSIWYFLKSYNVGTLNPQQHDKCEKVKDLIIYLYSNGESCYSIGKQLNISDTCISKFIKNHYGLDTQKYSKQRIDPIKNHATEIIKLYNSGWSQNKIAKYFDCGCSSIHKILKTNGILLRSKNKYTANYDFFENIDSEEKAYILGFMFADGNVRYNTKKYDFRVRLEIKDKDILEKIKELLEYTGPIYEKKNKNGKIQHGIGISSKKMSYDLIQLGCYPKKTFKIRTLPKLREDLMSHFIRGYFDGDGCISTSVNVMGNEAFLNEIGRVVGVEYKLYKRHKEKNTPTRSMLFTKKVEAKKFLDYIYKDATIKLDRKYQKYLNPPKRKYNPEKRRIQYLKEKAKREKALQAA